MACSPVFEVPPLFSTSESLHSNVLFQLLLCIPILGEHTVDLSMCCTDVGDAIVLIH
jgi:hypothetical protein